MAEYPSTRELPEFSYDWYIRRFEDSKKKAEETILPLDDWLFSLRPDESTWSVAECYSHVIVFNTIYYRNIAKGFPEAMPFHAPADPSFPPRWTWKQVARFFEPPYKIKVKTIKPFYPRSADELTRRQVTDDFLEIQDRLIEILEKAKNENIDLNSAKRGNPVLKILKMTLGEFYLLADAHQRRHFWQAEQILKRLRPQ